jgi:hypothetical protein
MFRLGRQRIRRAAEVHSVDVHHRASAVMLERTPQSIDRDPIQPGSAADAHLRTAFHLPTRPHHTRP